MIAHYIKDKNQLNSFLYLMIRGISVVANYLFSIFVIRLFSDSIYGQYVFGLSVFMLLSVFLKAGLDVHFVKLFAEFNPRGIPKWIRKAENKVIGLTVIVSILFCAGIWSFYKSPEDALILIIYILSVPFHVMIWLNSGKLRGISKITKFAFLNIAGRIVFTLLVLALIYFIFKDGGNIYSVHLSHLIAIVLLFIVSVIWARKEFSFSKENDTKIPKDFTSYNTGLLLKSSVTVLFMWGDRFLLSLASGNIEVAKYDISLKIALLIMIVNEALKSTYAPVFAKHAYEPEKFSEDVKKSTRMGFGFSFLLFLVILVFGKLLLGLFDPTFVESYPVLLVISFGYTVAAFFGQSDNILEMTGWVKHYLGYYFLIIILSLTLGVILSINMGALGMGIGIAIGNIVFQGVASLIVKSKMGIKTTFI